MKQFVSLTFFLAILLALSACGNMPGLPGTYNVMTSSMEPTFHRGDTITTSPVTRELQRGDIVVYEFQNSKSTQIHRIVGLPGESIEIKGGTVYIDGEPLTEPYIKEKPEYKLPVTLIPQGCYFVLGDNRNNAADSHMQGPIKIDNIRGIAK